MILMEINLLNTWFNLLVGFSSDKPYLSKFGCHIKIYSQNGNLETKNLDYTLFSLMKGE